MRDAEKGDGVTRRRGDGVTRRQGDSATRRYLDTKREYARDRGLGQALSGEKAFFVSPHLRVSVLRSSVSPVLRVPASRVPRRTCARRRYVIIQPPLPKELARPGVPKAALAATKENAQANKRRDIAEQHYRITPCVRFLPLAPIPL